MARKKSKQSQPEQAQDLAPIVATPSELAGLEPRREIISIEIIEQTYANHRHAHLHDQAKIDALAHNIKTNGQRTAIWVCERPEDDRLVLVAGHRRLAAVQRLGHASITADVFPPLTEGQIQILRAIENLQRQDLNIVEQVLAAAAAVRAAGGDVEQTAARLGRPATWVRDMLYLDERLAPEVKELGLQDKLLLGHLRELAKLGDLQLQERIAREACGTYYHSNDNDGGISRWSVDATKRRVEEARRHLKTVPWVLDIAFAGKPACNGCPHNTSSDQTLFGLEDEKGTGFCMAPGCYEAKANRAEKDKQKIAERIQAKKLEANAATVDKLKPEHMKRDPILRLAKKLIDAGGKTGTKPSTSSRSSGGGYRTSTRKLTAHEKALVAFRGDISDWGASAVEAIMKAVAESPRHKIALAILSWHKEWLEVEGSWTVPHVNEWQDQHQTGEPTPPEPLAPEVHELIRLFARAEMEDLEQLAAGIKLDRYAWIDDPIPGTHCVLMLEAMASALSLKLDSPPTWVEYIKPAEDDQAAGGKKPSKGKRKGKAAAASQDAGDTDADLADAELEEVADA